SLRTEREGSEKRFAATPARQLRRSQGDRDRGGAYVQTRAHGIAKVEGPRDKAIYQHRVVCRHFAAIDEYRCLLPSRPLSHLSYQGLTAFLGRPRNGGTHYGENHLLHDIDRFLRQIAVG